MNVGGSARKRTCARVAQGMLCIAMLLAIAACGDDLRVSAPKAATGDAVYLYNTTLASNGNITGGAGTRAALDGFVLSGANPPVCTGKTRHAFVSLSGGDAISYMPANFGFSPTIPVYGEMGPKLADSWADLMDGAIAASLVSAAAIASVYWTGANADGTHSGSSCGAWDNSGGGFGTYGDPTVTGSTWLKAGTQACNATMPVVGLCH